MQVSEDAYAVILAGGGGTRLWPKSRQKLPKHLVKLIGKQTIIRQTFDRIVPLIPLERILVITRKEQAQLVKKELPEIPKENIIEEPISKNTALAMGVAASFVHARNPNAAIINLAADQTIEDEEKFRKVIASALDVASARDEIISIGIQPTFPHTGLGYIRVGEPVDSRGKGKDEVFVFKSKGFKEKPDLATAQSFLATKEYLWNANLYCWSTKTVLSAFESYAPEIYTRLKKILETLKTKKDPEEILEQVYQEADNVQIDTAISEKVPNLVVIPGDFGWSDVGDWKVVYDTLTKNDLGNVVLSDNSIQVGTKNCLIEGNGRLIATVGLENIIIIDSDDAILICNKNATQDVKKIVEKLKELKKQEYL